MQNLHYVSIFLEAIIVVLCLLIGVKGKKLYGWGLALTFAVYVYYDFMKLTGGSMSQGDLAVVFFSATVSALASVWLIYRQSVY